MTKFHTFKVSTKRISDKAIIKTQFVSIPAVAYNTPKQVAEYIYDAMQLAGVKVQTVAGLGGGFNLYFECSTKDDKRYICEQIAVATVETNVPMQRIADMLVSVKESSYSPWVSMMVPVKDERGHEWYSDGERINADDVLFHVTFDDVTDEEGGGGTGQVYVTRAVLINGLQLMAVHAPEAFADLVSENDDAFTADIFMQFALLGKVVYG